MGASEWKECHQLAGEIPSRSVVREQLEPGSGCVDPSSHTMAAGEAGRHFPTGPRNDAGILGKRKQQTVKKRRIFVYGAGGHGKVVADILISKGESEFAGFVDDKEAFWGTKVVGFPAHGGRQWLQQESLHSPVAVALGVGANKSRQQLVEFCFQWNIEILTLVHPAATVSRTARIGQGTVVMAGAVINPDARVGAGVIVNTGAVVEHDVEVGDYAHVAPMAAMGGAARLGAFSHLGLGAVVFQCVHIGSHTIVGAGAVVVKNLPDEVVAFGVPARIQRQLQQECLSVMAASSKG